MCFAVTSVAQAQQMARDLTIPPVTVEVDETRHCVLLTFSHDYDVGWAVKELESKPPHFYLGHVVRCGKQPLHAAVTDHHDYLQPDLVVERLAPPPPPPASPRTLACEEPYEDDEPEAHMEPVHV